MEALSLNDGFFDYDKLVKGIKDGTYKKILVLTGAGISVSAGIPDFRTPGTGLYDNLKEYNLPNPEAIFTLNYFKENPEPFYRFAKNFDLSDIMPTPTHYFIKLLEDKGLLFKCITQNIDNLEEKAGMDITKNVVQAHGANRGASCSGCRLQHDFKKLEEAISVGEVMRCQKCEAPVKPDIVFFGENLPESFYRVVTKGFAGVDLAITMGTALAVYPFANIPTMVGKDTPQALFNMTPVVKTSGYNFENNSQNKCFVKGKCDETVI
jgi:NAD-dependent deacetylase sirtuin 2